MSFFFFCTGLVFSSIEELPLEEETCLLLAFCDEGFVFSSFDENTCLVFEDPLLTEGDGTIAKDEELSLRAEVCLMTTSGEAELFLFLGLGISSDDGERSLDLRGILMGLIIFLAFNLIGYYSKTDTYRLYNRL